MRAAGRIDEFTPEPAAAWLAARLHDARGELAHRWHRSFPFAPGVSDLIVAVAHDLRQPPELNLTTIARQSDHLLKFGGLVGQEMRQPLGVLQLMAALIPVREGDLGLTRLLDVFDRNVRRLADVAGRLERVSHDGLDASVMPGDETTDRSVVVADAVEKLREMA